jgi:ferredoxin
MRVDKAKCEGCAVCVTVCPVEAITLSDSKADIDLDLCIECLACMNVCPEEAISDEEQE